jgi:hypothetical protein
MKKYTFILEFKKGTYISQYYSNNLYAAITMWTKNLKIEDIEGMTLEKYEILCSKSLNNERPTQIQGLNGVWCMFFSLKNSSCLLNIVE